jgi:hypothetical protein
MKFLFVAALIAAGYAFVPMPHKNEVAKAGKAFSIVAPAIKPGIDPEMSPFTVGQAINSRVPLKGVAGFSKNGRPINAFYFPGSGDKRALIIGGVHGSELSAIEVAKNLIAQLEKEKGSYYSVIVIPCLFPDNAIAAASSPLQIGNVCNIGRYSHEEAADPNRQMPALGTAFHENDPFDYAGRLIEPENQLLLHFIQEFRPSRIVNLHAIRVTDKAGVYADPRTDEKGIAWEYTSDSSLAVEMAAHIEANGGHAPGNNLDQRPSALYYSDPVVAPSGKLQKRNLHGSRLPGNRGYGVSLGSWASTGVKDPLDENFNRAPIRLFTMEFPGCKRPIDYADPAARYNCSKEVDAYASSIRQVFLTERMRNRK